MNTVLKTASRSRLLVLLAPGKKIVSALLLAHYVGKPDSEIANGRVNSQDKWRAINEIKNEYYHTLFKNNEALAQNASYPLFSIYSATAK